MTINKKKFKKLIPEKPEQIACFDLLGWAGFKVFRYNTGGMKHTNPDGSIRYIRFNESGHPDIGGRYRNGKAFYWEVKRHGKKATTDQKQFIADALDDNCIAGIGTCEDLEKMLRGLGYVK